MKTKLLLPAVFAVLLINCSGDPIKKDLVNYINVELPKVVDLETKSIEAYAAVIGDNYQNDSILYSAISTVVVPTYTEFYNTLEKIKPATPEIAAMHKEYVDAASDNLEAFRLILQAVEKQDVALIDKSNADLAKGRQLIRDWKTKLDEEVKAHDISITAK